MPGCQRARLRLTAPVSYCGLRLGSYQDQRQSPSARVPAVMLHTRLGVFGVSVDSSNIKLVGQRLPRHLWVLCSVYCCRQKGSYITTEISCALTLQPTLQSCCEFEPSDTAHFFLLRCGRLVPESDGIPSSLASYQNISPSSWSCLHCGFAADYLQCRHQGRSTQVLSSSRELTFIFDTHVLFWMGDSYHPQENRAACVSTCPRYAS